MRELLERVWDVASPDEVVAFGRGGARLRAELCRDVAFVAERLQSGHPADKALLMVFREDRYAFAVTLLAAWSLQIPVALPPNTRRETIAALLLHASIGEMAHDLDAGMGFSLKHLLAEAAERAPDTQPPRLASAWEAGAVIATLYSSGTTSGMGTSAPKTAAQLLGEARSLARDVMPAGARVVATVQPAHIYGLLYSVLVPLLSGGAFLRETPFFPESVADAIRAHEATVLVTVPAHLQSFQTLQPDAFTSLARIVSSTAPLPHAAAVDFLDRFGQPITEVLGSSETGGLARRLSPTETMWHPLSGVRLAASDDGRLLVDSSFLHPDEPRPYLSADLVRFEGEVFEHLGRADGVVKIAGRRLSLREMEERVRQMDGVEDAAVLALDAVGLRGKRLFLVVAGERVDTDGVLAELAAHYDSSCLPRRVEHVEKLPREDNGKLPRARLLSLFGMNAEGDPFVWELQWGAMRVGPDEEEGRYDRRFVVEVPAAYRWFEGHFHGYPVMAAAIQLHELVAPALEQTLGAGRVTQVRQMKFTGRILPRDQVEVRLAGPAENLVFSIWKGEERCSTGQVVWRGQE